MNRNKAYNFHLVVEIKKTIQMVGNKLFLLEYNNRIYSCPLVFMGDWLQDPLRIPKSVNTQDSY
jgi:hypothetical protein